MILTTNSDYFPKQHQPAGLCSGDVMCFLWGTNWIYIYCILPTQCIYVFRMIPTINSDYFPKQHQPAGLCSGDVMCFPWGANWIFIYCILPTQCVYVFRMIPTINSDCFLHQHQPAGLCSGDVMCFPWGANWIFIYYSDHFMNEHPLMQHTHPPKKLTPKFRSKTTKPLRNFFPLLITKFAS
jgi:hypothetical protein